MKRYYKLFLSLIFVLSVLFTLSGVVSAAEMNTAIGIVNTRGGLRLREKAIRTSRIPDVARDGDAVVTVRRTGDLRKVHYTFNDGNQNSATDKQAEPFELVNGVSETAQLPLLQDPSSDALARLTSGKEFSIFERGWCSLPDDLHRNSIELSDSPNSKCDGARRLLKEDDDVLAFPATESAGIQLAAYAQSFVGHPYVYGGTSPSGFDCSGFMQYVFAHFGYRISRTATAQLADGYKVSWEDLQPGDIIYFGYGNVATHVGMYIGNDQFVHAENPSTGVVITGLSTTSYAGRFLTAHRITD